LGPGSAVTLEDVVRRAWAAICLAVIVVADGCGGSEMTDYVERVNAVLDRAMERYEELVASPQGEVLVAEGAQLADFTPQDLQAALERVGEIQAEALEATDAIEPPEQITDLHDLFFRELPIEALAARAGTAADWEELSESREMAAYRGGLVADKQVCTDFQAQLDAATERGAFADTPWLGGEMEEIVEAAIGCASLPEHPENAYLPPPISTP
jgi:hypothetical protein